MLFCSCFHYAIRSLSQIRVLIVTDSLGMPRPEIQPSKVWVNKFSKTHQNFQIHFFLERSITTTDIVKRIPYILTKDTDVIIFQVGIVDCARRAAPRTLVAVTSRIPIVASITRRFLSLAHYPLTKAFEFKAVSRDLFVRNLHDIFKVSDHMNIKVGFIRIADAGDKLKKKIYQCQNDIDLYNKLLKEVIAVHVSATYIDPYYDKLANDYILLSDGHHLNEAGHQLVFNSVSDWIESFTCKE